MLKRYFLPGFLVLCTAFSNVCAQQKAEMRIFSSQIKNTVSPTLHGIFFEEISHGGEGGLYAEMIQNRGFEENRLPPGTHLENGFIVPERTPHYNLNGRASDWKMPWRMESEHPYWHLDTASDAAISIRLTKEQPLNTATPQSLEITVSKLSGSGKNDLVNEGFWGINAVKNQKYLLGFYARTDDSFKGPLTAALVSESGEIMASRVFNGISADGWKKYEVELIPKESDPKAKFVFTFGSEGKLWMDFVSLFPEATFKERRNGLRKDLAQYLADLKPAFVRWPGGCFVEGINVESAPNWKTSIGPVEQRPGTFSVWGYWSSDGLGYHEFLQFCEDIGSQAMYVFNAGVSCEFRSGTFVPDDELQPVIDDILDAIEYAVGPADSKWGKLRSANGHPDPFPLKYVEVGNEQHGPWYAKRYNRFHAAIKEKYPDIQIISSMGIGDINRHTLDSIRVTDIADEHAYKPAGWPFSNFDHFDGYKRGDYDVYVGEYATNAGVEHGNMLAALNDAVYILGMENNGDLVKMSSYAPLFENVNTRHWPVNLINFNAAESFARISYYAIQMMNEHRADQNVVQKIKLSELETPKPRFHGGIGLATWDTQTEYKDIEVISNGKSVYKSDFISHPEEWKPIRGSWKVQDNAIAQTAQGAQLLNTLSGHTFDTYSLKLKARKISGTNAFIIPFGINELEGGSFYRAHIGSYVNQNFVFEQVSGQSVIDITRQKRLPAPIEIGKWYDIRLEVGTDQVACYLNDELLMEYTEPSRLIGLAGKDTETGDLIIKMVNGYSEACVTNISLEEGFEPRPEASAFVLSAEPSQENSFENPRHYVPVKTDFRVSGQNFTYTFKPNSITVLRLRLWGR